VSVQAAAQPASEQAAGRKIAIARAADFPPGARMEVKVGNTLIAVFNLAGTYYAIYGRCPHQFAPLSRGRLQGTVICSQETDWEIQWAHDGEVLVCPGHAMEFLVKTGQAIGYELKLRTYPVVVEDGMVMLIA
jgi:nitrite reductase (NADH) small subunit